MKKSHTCVFFEHEVEELRKFSVLLASLAGNMKIMIVVFVSLISILLVPVGVMLSQAAMIGSRKNLKNSIGLKKRIKRRRRRLKNC